MAAAGYMVDVERLVLGGVRLSSEQAVRLRFLLERELERELRRPGALVETQEKRAVSRRDLPPVELRGDIDETALAVLLARRVASELRNQEQHAP